MLFKKNVAMLSKYLNISMKLLNLIISVEIVKFGNSKTIIKM